MSWSITVPKASSATAVNDALKADANIPAGIKGYISQGIDGMVAKHGSDVLLDVTGYGHLFKNDGTVEETTASITIRRSKPE
jgi:hypothetical protein